MRISTYCPKVYAVGRFVQPKPGQSEKIVFSKSDFLKRSSAGRAAPPPPTDWDDRLSNKCRERL